MSKLWKIRGNKQPVSLQINYKGQPYLIYDNDVCEPDVEDVKEQQELEERRKRIRQEQIKALVDKL